MSPHNRRPSTSAADSRRAQLLMSLLLDGDGGRGDAIPSAIQWRLVRRNCPPLLLGAYVRRRAVTPDVLMFQEPFGRNAGARLYYRYQY